MSFAFLSSFSRQALAIRPQVINLRQPLLGNPTSVLQQACANFRSVLRFSTLQVARASRPPNKFQGFIYKAAGLGSVASVGIGISVLSRPTIHCDASTTPVSTKETTPHDLPPPPVSSVSLYELSFGTLAGVCAGVFIKKGAKALAWFLGGIFVLLQYLGSQSLVRVDWSRMASRYESMFYRQDSTGTRKAPTVGGVWKGLVNFLTADLQPRASFLAGLALGLRVG